MSYFISMSESDNIQNIGQDEFPFYEEDSTNHQVPTEKKQPLWDNAVTLSTYRLSRPSAPSPNTIVPTLSTGLLPVSIIPVAAAVSGYIYSRDGLTRYKLYVETNGALSIDPA